MNDNRPKPDMANVPLMPSVARRIIEELFQLQTQWRRADLAAEVERIHLKRGGLKGKQDSLHIIKKALSVLEEDGRVCSPAYGQWRWRTADNQGVHSPPLERVALEGIAPDEAAMSIVQQAGEELTPEKAIGEGPETVYVYFNPNDRKLVELEGRTTWECKIGRTASVDASGRIIGQGAKTALSRLPVIGLVIRSQDAGALERALHASLRLIEKEVEDSPGTEWFMTSPARVEAWYVSFQMALAQLGAAEESG